MYFTKVPINRTLIAESKYLGCMLTVELSQYLDKVFLYLLLTSGNRGHKSVETTMVYTHIVADMNKSRVASPLDML